MKTADIKRMALIARTFRGYDDGPKADFARIAKRYLKELAKAMGMKDGEYQVRYNPGGIAVLGEATLHSNNLYLQLSNSSFGDGTRFMYRTCKGQKDYTGGSNQWGQYSDLCDYSVEEMANRFKRFLAENEAEWSVQPRQTDEFGATAEDHRMLNRQGICWMD